MKNLTIQILIVIAALVAMVAVGKVAIDKHEVATCLSLQNQAKEYEDFIINKYDREMCDIHGISVLK